MQRAQFTVSIILSSLPSDDLGHFPFRMAPSPVECGTMYSNFLLILFQVRYMSRVCLSRIIREPHGVLDDAELY